MSSTKPPTRHQALLDWVEHWRAILEPDRVEWCDGSDEEYEGSASSWSTAERSCR